MDANRSDLVSSFGLLLLRAGAGGYLATHGWGKLHMVIEGQFDAFADPIGLGLKPSLILAMLAEFGCSLLVVVGLFTRLAAIPVVFTMAVAAFVVHASDPWSMETAAKAYFAGTSKTWSSKQPALLFLIPFLALVFTGPGRFSLDRLIWARRPKGSPPVA
jgi:putative oxidoreductase